MKDLLARFTSRTFWITLSAFLGFMVVDQHAEAAAVVIAYVLGEKVKDTVEVQKGLKTYQNSSISYIDDEAPDQSRIVTGVGTIRPADAE